MRAARVKDRYRKGDGSIGRLELRRREYLFRSSRDSEVYGGVRLDVKWGASSSLASSRSASASSSRSIIASFSCRYRYTRTVDDTTAEE